MGRAGGATVPVLMAEHPVHHRAMHRLAAMPWFSRLGPRVAPRVDRLASRLTGGRWTVTDSVLPAVVLTTIGARSGLPRTVPLAALDLDGDWVVVGSNFGQARHPAWSTNLLSHPDALVQLRGERHLVRAELLDDDGRREVWPMLLDMWPLFDRYAEASGRDLRVFRLRRVRRSVI